MEDWTTTMTPARDSQANVPGGVRRANRRVH
jgi:hypothetical protein